MGGMSEYMTPNGVMPECVLCDTIATELSIFGLRPEALSDAMEGLRVSVPEMDVDLYHTMLDSSSSPTDFNTMLLLVHLLLTTKVEKEEKYLKSIMSMLEEQRMAEDRDPQSVFERKVDLTASGNHPYYRPYTIGELRKLDFDKACATFRDLLRNPEEWVFTLAGKLPPLKETLSSLHKYLGSLPRGEQASGLNAETVTIIEVPPITRKLHCDVSFPMVESGASSSVRFHFPIVLPGQLDLMVRCFQSSILWRLFETKLVETLRFKMGKLYNISVYDNMETSSVRPGEDKKGMCIISFECDCHDIPVLKTAVKQVLDNLRTTGFPAEDIDNVKKQLRIKFEDSLRRNGFWKSTIMDLYQSAHFRKSGDIGALMLWYSQTYMETIESFTPEVGLETLRRLLPENGPLMESTLVHKRSFCTVC